MKRNNLLKFCFWGLFLIFLYSYFIETNGYYEYNLANRRNLTEEQMKRFEEDVSEGKNIDLDYYLDNVEVDYSNKLTKTTTEASLKLNEYLKKVIGNILKILEKFVY